MLSVASKQTVGTVIQVIFVTTVVFTEENYTSGYGRQRKQLPDISQLRDWLPEVETRRHSLLRGWPVQRRVTVSRLQLRSRLHRPHRVCPSPLERPRRFTRLLSPIVNYLRQGRYVFTRVWLFVCLFVCLSVCLLNSKTADQIFMKFYRMVRHDQSIGFWVTLTVDPTSRSLEIVRSKSSFVNKSVQNCRRVSQQKLQSSLFNSLHNSTHTVKKWVTLLLPITLPNVDRFSQFFHQRT